MDGLLRFAVHWRLLSTTSKEWNMSDQMKTQRVLGFRVARELTVEEMRRVSGGASSNAPSYSGYFNPRQDDVLTDEK
jgi:hypothetical protein